MDTKPIAIPKSMDFFHTRLRQELRRRSIKPLRFACECEVSSSQMGQYLTGKRTPAMATLQRVIFNLPDVDAYWLIMGSNYEEPA